jgi:ABC-type antimicrobial peptide transport system permease subunit
MIRNYLKIAIRNLARHKGYSFINIAGLAVGMTACILILLWVQDELNYDRFNENAANLYYVAQDHAYPDGRHVITTCTPGPLAPALIEEFPEVVNAARYTSFSEPISVAYGENRYHEIVRSTDNSIFEMFTFPFVKGDARTALTQPYSIVISEEMARKYFADEDPIGKMLLIGNQFDFKVTGVMADIPDNSSIMADFFTPFEFVVDLGESPELWGRNNYDNIIQLQKGVNYHEFSKKIEEVVQQHRDTNVVLFLHPLLKMHLYSLRGSGGDIVYVRIFSLIAVIILLIACINFMNLATARSEHRAKEVGLRKVVGAGRKQLMIQFFGESVFLAILALLIAIILVELLSPVFNELAGKELALNLIRDFSNLVTLVIITLATGVLAGSYPALFLSAFKPVRTIRGITKSKGGGRNIRRTLVIVQFTLSIILIICTTVIYKQITFMQNKKLGINRENVLRLPIEGLKDGKYASVKAELLKLPKVLSVTAASHWPHYISSNTGGSDWEGKDPDQNVLIGFTAMDFDYDKTFNLEMAEGRFYSQEFPSDSSLAVVLNQAAINAMGMDSPIGKRFSIADNDLTIIGVTENFHFKPLHWEVEPMMMLLFPPFYNHVFVRVAGEDIQRTMAYIEDVYKRLNPSCPFEFTFVDEKYDRLYRDERRMGQLFRYFTVLAIFVSGLGLVGLAAFAAEQRTKEIGIRKVLGATITNIIGLISKEFVFIIIVASFIAGPVAYYFMSSWLQGFAYRTHLSLWIFLGAGLGILIMALAIVSSQAIRAATADPVKSLRYE